MRKEIVEIAGRQGISEDRAFAVWYGIHMLRLDEIEAVDAASYDGGNDRGIDVFYVDDGLERVVIGQTKYLKRSDKAPTPGDLALLLDTVDELVEPQEFLQAGRSDLAEAAEALADARDRGYSIQLHFIYPGRKNDELERRIRQFNRRSLGDDISAEIARLEDLELAAETGGIGSRVAEATVSLSKGAFHQESGKYGKSLIASVSGSEIKRLYEEHGNRLFDQNVRLFLGARKGSVNAGIRQTIGSPDDRTNFWAFNNGITIVTSSFDLDESAGSVTIFDFSIVNGCQTTVSMAEASDTAASEMSVLARIVAARPELVDRIIQFTNSQTPINVWDLSARDKTHQRLKSELEDMSPPWFYALRRGEFEGLDNKAKFGPWGARRVLQFPTSSQYVAAFKGLPVEAYKDKARLFTIHKDRVFPPDITASELLWAWKVGLAVEKAIEAYKESVDLGEVETQVLKRGGRFFATAIAAQLLRARNGSDFVALVDASRLQDSAMVQRITKYARLAVSYYVNIMSDLVVSGADLGVLQRNTDTADRIRKKVEGRIFEEAMAPKALDEKLPKLPGIA